ncbi:MAG: AGE family epimerase/isomerase [Alphaproteobacteria bacterium]|nr:AGE family epimerase/isomerase [Alphaproteobacteria bacterium]MBU1516838.1 AGE family epimerase/isomerase [Alphaproteobacteria bacterium]MBU2092532.1 AGE family epimerase/isomerase [Alphaproteobacteria bacterium]MBU2151356.1 AGE family epimerase/isomerase [Alphaproteobacteria bacterium]MBU2309659.1 AGE family epimerase/isomerase [Alphaproteobacteria bacterium]
MSAAAAWYDGWLREAALPLWAGAGVDPDNGGFREALTWAGAPHDPRYRTRVQARQAFVYATAAADGIAGPWRAVAEKAFDRFVGRARREDRMFAAVLAPDGTPTDRTAYLYEHAFVLLAAAALGREGLAREVRQGLDVFRHAAGGFREAGDRPFQANALMHLFEAALAWEAAGGDVAWAAMTDELAELALGRFIDPATGALSEFFDPEWRRLAGERGLIEPGHQFEWAWLLDRWGAARGRADAGAAARRLFDCGRRGFDAGRNVAVDALTDNLAVRDGGARLWPQTEHLKAALALGDEAAALEGANGLAAYLDTPARGAWRERMRADGTFVEEPSPATSFYHLFLAVRELTRLAGEA